jgi:hypothetical protein
MQVSPDFQLSGPPSKPVPPFTLQSPASWESLCQAGHRPFPLRADGTSSTPLHATALGPPPSFCIFLLPLGGPLLPPACTLFSSPFSTEHQEWSFENATSSPNPLKSLVSLGCLRQHPNLQPLVCPFHNLHCPHGQVSIALTI